MQPLELAFRHRVEVETTNALLDTRALQRTKENLGSTGIRDCAFAQTTFDLRIRRGLVLTTGCAVRSYARHRSPDRQGVPAFAGIRRSSTAFMRKTVRNQQLARTERRGRTL